MKRRITKAIRARLIAAQRKGHYAQAVLIRKQLEVIKQLSRREVKSA